MSKSGANGYFDVPTIDEEAFVVHPTKAEMRQFNMVCCAKCHQTKHPRQFRRPLTWAQARARGYKGQRLMYVPSKFCRACSPATFRPSEMTAREIRDAAYNGRVSRTRANIAIYEKEQRAKALKKAAVGRRWHDHYAKPWVTIVQLLRVELSHQRKVYPGTAGLLMYHRQLVQRIRARCELNAKSEEPYPNIIGWTYFMSDTEYLRLQQLWAEAPSEKLKWLHPLPLLRPLNLLLADPTSVASEQASTLRYPLGVRLHKGSPRKGFK